ncbi:DYX1C1 [Lepeophtheirus salmonis]|uniref:DYX1C1 n=1 Tax=Lepeophtheirus salmonis TaxID=72036 RepID=A0A7R8CUG0_LEPSM|nr:DYX1C1 [Lepeophtheirus salmonis]CAF2935857.1 DYX1C1 [Lepeophtheirus salmonis]
MTINGDQLLLDLCKANNGEVWKSVDLSGSLSREDKIDLRLKSQEWISEYSKNLCTRKINEVKCHDTSLLVKLAMEKDRILPVVRSPGCIMVTFTPRSAPTPLRENKKENEGEWLRKKWEAFSRAEGIQVSEINEDLDPTQILGKGNYLMSTEDILSAVSIYTHGIKLFPKMAAMYNNRSVAYIKIKNYEEALHDIHMALKFLLPPVNDNLNQRTKSTMRKSYILFKLDRIKDAINELDVASKLMPDNVEIASYLESLKELSDEDESLDESD